MQVTTTTMVIASGGTTSSALELEAYDLLGIDIPTIDSATLTIQGSADGSTYRNIIDSTGTQQCVLSASTGNKFWGATALAHANGAKFIKLVAGAAQNSGAVTFTVVRKKVFPR